MIELMVVIAIIGILATAGITQYANYQARARDTVRIQDISGFQTALATYQADNWQYPDIWGTCLEDLAITGWTVKLWAALSTKIPRDPSSQNISTPCAKPWLYGYKLLDGPTGIQKSSFLLTARMEDKKKANLNGALATTWTYDQINTNMSLPSNDSSIATARDWANAIYAKLN